MTLVLIKHGKDIFYQGEQVDMPRDRALRLADGGHVTLVCPDCGAPLPDYGHCKCCRECGYSKCGG